MSAPYYYDTINQVDSHIIPGTLKLESNALAQYYRRYLAQKAFAILQFHGLPDTWDEEYLKFVLLCWGFAAVINTDKFGVIPQQCGVSGYNVFYRPTRAIVVNPLFDKAYDLVIGRDCELIRLSPDWRGIPDLIGHYADLMALTQTSIITNLYNSRLSYVFAGSTKAFAESFKKMFDQISSGNPAVFVDKNLIGEDGSPNWQLFQQDLKSTYIIDLLQAAERCIMSQFYTEVGIPNIPFEKNERLTQSESTTGDYATQCLVDLWRRTINSTLQKVNAMFGLNITVDYNDTLLEVMRGGSQADDLGTEPVQT